MSLFPGVQLAHEWEGWPERGAPDAYLVEPKYDGYRLSTVIDQHGAITFHCRDAKQPDWAENLGHIRDVIEGLRLRSMMLDGEVMGANWNETSKLLRKRRAFMSAAHKARITQEVKFFMFDVVDLGQLTERVLPRHKGPKTVYDEETWRRRFWLEKLKDDLEDNCFVNEVSIVPQYKAANASVLNILFEELLELEYEGAIVKDPTAPYVFDRSHYWLKMKPHKTIELKIIDSVEEHDKHDQPKNALGAFVCEDENGVVIQVGGGYTRKQRQDFWRCAAQMVGRTIEVKVQDSSVAKARHPQFLRIRDDK